MPSLSAVRAYNAAFSPPYTPVAVFVGGTSGIGQSIAGAFAQHVKGNAHIIIIGRNRTAAESFISQLPKPASGSNTSHEFIQCDVTLMKNVDVATKELLTRVSKINFLVLTPGFMTTKGRDETEEGIDKQLAVNYYARWKFINDLFPALTKAREAGEDAKVLSVLGAGKGKDIDLGDLGLKKTFSSSNATFQTPTYTDLMMEEFAHRNPDVSFVHAYPGVVRTSIMSSSDSKLLKVASPVVIGLTYPFSTSPKDTGEYMLHGLLNATKGAVRVGSRGEDIGKKGYFGSDEARKKLWEHTVEATQVSS